jgi:hypothetical protein
MRTCSVCHAQSPDTATICLSCKADLDELSTSAVALKRIQKNERIKQLHIAVSADCCPACRAVEGAYPKDQAPHLPVEGCSHNLGCRCFYQPVIDVLYP